eukprot:CAMPEP_0118714194 /NCGR_PEP_ID=MMETSP0800-20121206/26028_1 /TAXON_ID=210618 ORGANISM="Striatella unipunctata, Strain CCMP2910" /NCGR_SAMPLE_ID=MMETSP0800 /ASSEMBLY_ACC=CAM_ASM_000638 /LENGTH=69 /DNA_ID=CAMNT_0006619913 /DNA_START=32 /DNA_END=241 /DNA_ORIENTATION=-
MKTFSHAMNLLLAAILLLAVSTSAFSVSKPQAQVGSRFAVRTRVNMGFLGDKERDVLSRDNEPEEYFAT